MSTAEQRAPGSSLRRAFSVMAVRNRLLRHLRQALSVLVTWCQLRAFPLFQKGWKSSQAGSRVFLRGFSVIQGRAAGRLSRTSAVTPHPKLTTERENGIFRQWVCKAGARLCSQRKINTPLPPCQPATGEGVRKTDGSSPA